MFDYLIKDGMLLDGSGKPGFAGDIAIQGGKIAAIGRIDAAAARVISASDLVVTPGFIDIHRHADAAVFRPDFGQLELHQGLTTIVNGNCGLSLAPVSPAHKAEILGYMSPITGRVPSHIETATMDGYLEQVGRGSRSPSMSGCSSAAGRCGPTPRATRRSGWRCPITIRSTANWRLR